MNINLIASLLILASAARAQNICRLYLLNQTDGASGLVLSLEATTDSTGKCGLGSMNLRLAVGDGTSLHHVDAPFAWQMGVVYTAKAIVTANGPHQLTINGQASGSAQGAFRPASVTLAA